MISIFCSPNHPPAGHLILIFIKNITTHQNYLSFARGKSSTVYTKSAFDQADWTDWILLSLLPSNLMEEISPNSEALKGNSETP